MRVPHLSKIGLEARVADRGQSLVKRSDNPLLSPIQKDKALGLIGNGTKPLIERARLPARGRGEALDMTREHAAEPTLVAADRVKHRVQHRVLRLLTAKDRNLCTRTLALQQQIEKAQ